MEATSGSRCVSHTFACVTVQCLSQPASFHFVTSVSACKNQTAVLRDILSLVDALPETGAEAVPEAALQALNRRDVRLKASA
eukprot:4206942-Pleurochrysis_carterae.AAC.3